MKQDMTYTFRLPREIWKNYLKEMEPGTASKFIREAIIDKINREHTTDYMDQQINFHMTQVKEWKEKKKELKADPEKINSVLGIAQRQLEKWQDGNQSVDIMQLKRYLQSSIIPKLSAVGCNDLSLDKILELIQGGVKYE